MKNDLVRLKDQNGRAWSRARREKALQHTTVSDRSREYAVVAAARKEAARQTLKIKALRHH